MYVSNLGKINELLVLDITQWARKFKNVKAKKTREMRNESISRNFCWIFSESILIYMENIKKKIIREIDLFDFTSFFGLDIFLIF